MIIRLAVTIEDADGDTATGIVRCSVPPETQLGDVEALYMTPFFEAWAGMTRGAALNAEATLEFDNTPYRDYTSEPSVYSDVEEKMNFVFRTSTGHTWEISIPAWREEFYQAGSGALPYADLTNESVQLLITVLTNGIEDGGIDAVDRHGQDISVFLYSKEQFISRKRR